MISHNKPNLIFLGIILSAHGIQGQVLVKSFTSPTANITRLDLVSHLGEKIILKLIKQNSKGGLICKINEIHDRTEAEQLKGLKLFCYRASLPSLEEDEFYITDLINLPVMDQNMNLIGKINNIYNFGAGDIIEIIFINNKVNTRLLPNPASSREVIGD